MEPLSHYLDVTLFTLGSIAVACATHLWLKKRFSGSLKPVVWVGVLVTCAVAWVRMDVEERSEKLRIENLLSGYARLFAMELEREGHHLITFDTPPDDPHYLQLIELQKRWLQAAPRVHDVYTLRRLPSGKKALLVDSETDYDRDGAYDRSNEGRTEIGEGYDAEAPGMDLAFEGVANFDSEPTEDRWGTWVSASCPLHGPDGSVDAIVGVDYDADAFSAAGRSGRFRVLGYMLSLQVLLLGAGGLLSLARGQLRERESAAARLAESERRFRDFMDNSPAVAFVKDEDGRYLYVNRTFEQILGRSESMVLGRSDMEIWTRDIADSLRAHDLEVVEKNVPLEAVEQVPDAGGRERSWFVAKFPLRNREGRMQVGGVAVDISRQLQLEEEIRQSQKMETVGQLAAGVAHDFNNALMIVASCADLITSEPNDPEEVRYHAGLISRSADQAAILVQRLLTFSRKQPITKSLHDVRDLIESLAALLRRTLGDQIAVRSSLEPGLPAIEVDSVLIEQLLMNIAVNARDAMPNGGDLTFAARRVSVENTAGRGAHARVGDFVCIEVEDTGCGMAPATIQRIFEPFFTTKEVGKGTGLGLASAYGIALQHGGWIEVISAPGEGSAFHVYIPAAKSALSSAAPAALPPSQRAPFSFAGLKVLLVEDDPHVRLVVRLLLGQSGFAVLEADSPAAAEPLWEANREDIDLVVTDMMMPGGVNGLSFATSLLEEKPDLRVLCMTGYSADLPALRDLKDPRIALLLKPFGPSELQEIVMRMMIRC